MFQKAMATNEAQKYGALLVITVVAHSMDLIQ